MGDSSTQTSISARDTPGTDLPVLKEALDNELKTNEGTRNILDVLNLPNSIESKERRQLFEAELHTSNQKIYDLQAAIARLSMLPRTPSRGVDKLPPFKPDDDDDDWDRRWKGGARYGS